MVLARSLSWFAASVVIYHSAQAAPAAAQDEPAEADAAEAPAEAPDARELFSRGQAAYERGDYEDSVEAWEAGYELDPQPLLQYNLGQAYERLGELPKAVGAFETYLENADPSDPNQQRARSQLAAIRERLGRTSVVISGGPDGAAILIDGEDRGRTPRPDPIAVEPGSHQVEVVLEGYRPFEAMVSVAAGRSVEVEAVLEEDTGAEEGPPLVPIILWAGGGAALIAGAILGGVALGKANGADTSDGPDADSARGLALGADIAIGVGVLAAGAGLLVYLLSGGDGAEADEVAFTPTAGPGFAGAMARGSF